MGFLTQMEQKYGRFAIPGILRILGGFQLLVLVLALFSGEEGNSFLGMLHFTREGIFSGQVWRLLTFLFIPPTFNPLWGIIAVMFLFMLSDGLEQAWGSFRVNVYVLAGALLLIFANLFLGAHPAATGFYIFEAVLLAFACIYPNHIIHLFLVLPIKMKWVGAISAGMMLIQLFGMRLYFYPVFMNMLMPLIPFFVVFGPAFLKGAKHKGEVSARRQKFNNSQPDEEDPLHTCTSCSKTEISDPELEFRVTADGDEYCSPCLTELRGGESANESNQNS